MSESKPAVSMSFSYWLSQFGKRRDTAEEAGLQEGDEIIRMNHFSVHFSREITAYGTFHSGETIKVTYARDGQNTYDNTGSETG